MSQNQNKGKWDKVNQKIMENIEKVDYIKDVFKTGRLTATHYEMWINDIFASDDPMSNKLMLEKIGFKAKEDLTYSSGEVFPRLSGPLVLDNVDDLDNFDPTDVDNDENDSFIPFNSDSLKKLIIFIGIKLDNSRPGAQSDIYTVQERDSLKMVSDIRVRLVRQSTGAVDEEVDSLGNDKKTLNEDGQTDYDRVGMHYTIFFEWKFYGNQGKEPFNIVVLPPTKDGAKVDSDFEGDVDATVFTEDAISRWKIARNRAKGNYKASGETLTLTKDEKEEIKKDADNEKDKKMANAKYFCETLKSWNQDRTKKYEDIGTCEIKWKKKGDDANKKKKGGKRKRKTLKFKRKKRKTKRNKRRKTKRNKRRKTKRRKTRKTKRNKKRRKRKVILKSF